MKTLSKFEENKIDLKNTFGGKGGNGPSMKIIGYTIVGQSEGTLDLNTGVITYTGGTSVPIFEFDAAVQ